MSAMLRRAVRTRALLLTILLFGSGLLSGLDARLHRSAVELAAPGGRLSSRGAPGAHVVQCVLAEQIESSRALAASSAATHTQRSADVSLGPADPDTHQAPGHFSLAFARAPPLS